MKNSCNLNLISVLFIFLLSFSKSALAHRDDYIDETLVYLTLEKKEIEPEYWFDFGYKHDEDANKNIGLLRHNFALEYGITDHWMVDGRGTIKNMEDKKTVIDSGRFETRYRFFEEGAKPIDVAISAEANAERDEHGKMQPALEPRMILSKDFKELNFTANLAEKIFLREGELTFIPSLGIRYNTPRILRVGCEIRFDTRSHEDSVIPQIWFALPYEITIKLGYSFGFNRNEENFGRLAIEVGF